MESRKDRTGRIAGGTVIPEDVSNAMGFVNRLRSAFEWVRTIVPTEPLTEVSVDGLLIVKASVQEVADAAEGAERVIRNLVLTRAADDDDLFVPSLTTDTLFLGLPTHPKRFSVEQRTRSNFDQTGFLASLVADGVLTQAQVDARVARFTTYATRPAVAYKPNPEYAEEA